MSRVLTLQFKDLNIPVRLQVFSRDTLYGKSTIEINFTDILILYYGYLSIDRIILKKNLLMI